MQSQQSTAKCAVTLITSAGTAPAVAKSAFHARNTFFADQDFDLEVIETMSAAFVSVCDALHLKIGDPAARFVAEKVIKLAQRGVRDPNVLRRMTLGLSDESASVASAAPKRVGQTGL